MGLDATVYKDDEESGKIATYYIGNLACVGNLRQNINRISPDAEVLLSKVLYNGMHCGDSLSKELILQAKSEVESLNKIDSIDEGLRVFISEFSKIIDVALEHDRPITF